MGGMTGAMRALAVLAVLASAPAGAGAGLGVNLEGIADWAAVLPFADAMKSARRFGPPDRPWEERAPVDAAGWPTGDAGVVVFADQQGIAGDYRLEFAGVARVEAHGAAAVLEARHDAGRGRTTAVVRVPAGEGNLFLAFRDTRGGVREVALRRPVEVAAGHFDRRFIEAVRGFGALRFMDWQRANGNPVARWDERPLPGAARWSGAGGVPLEIQVACANAAGCDAWFCIPHLADDDYARRAAVLVRDTLAPGLKAYVELSNECWNGQFEQARWCAAEGRRLGLSDDAHQAQLRCYSQRAAEVARIWDGVFGGDRGRLVRVMASQAANPWVSEQVLGWRGAARAVDLLAIAPYFGGALGAPERRAEVVALGVDGLLDALARDELGDAVPAMLRRQKEVADRFGVRLGCYEAGQHLVGHGGAENDEALTRLFIAANRHPRMEALYQEYLGLWDALDAGPAFLFSFSGRPSKWGSWGLVEGLPADPARHPKLRAVARRLGAGGGMRRAPAPG